MSGFGYTLSRDLDAPVAEAWAAWTERERFAVWFGAAVDTVALDVRPGGAWKATLQAPDGNEYPLAGSYGDVVENERLVTLMDVPGRAEPETMVTEFTDLGEGRSRVVISQVCQSAEECAQAEQGSGMLLEQLATYLTK